MREEEPVTPPPVRLGHVADESVAATLCVLVRQGARERPGLSAELRGSVLMRFGEGYAPVRIDFRGDEIEVADDEAHEDRAHDLQITGRLGDLNALIAAPLAGGLPKPTTRRGRHAIARLADGRIDIDGPLALARSVLRLLAVDAMPAAKSGRRARAADSA